MLVIAGSVGAGSRAPELPPGMPLTTRERLAPVTELASLATQVDGKPFQARREIFEYLLDHPDFATHVTRAVRAARYRIWSVPGGFGIDDGWGTVGTFEVVYAAPGVRVMHAKGEYQQPVLPDIQGEAIVTIRYVATPAENGKSTIAAAVGSYVKLDSALLRTIGLLATSMAEAKAQKEGVRLVKTFARATRAVEDDPRAVCDAISRHPDVPRRELDEFRRLLSLPSKGPAATAQR